MVVIDRESKYLPRPRVPDTVAHDSAIVYALPEFHPPAQHIGGKRLACRSGLEFPDIGVGQFSCAKFQIHCHGPTPPCALSSPLVQIIAIAVNSTRRELPRLSLKSILPISPAC